MATERAYQQYGPLMMGIMGSCSQLGARTLFAPTRRVQIVLVTAPSHPLVRSGSIRPFEGPADIVERLVRSGAGLRALWNGHTVQLTKGVVRAAWSLLVVRPTEHQLLANPWRAPGWKLAVGSVALLLSAPLLENPFDVVYSCIAGDLTACTFSGPMDALRAVVSRGGPLALFDGLALQYGVMAATYLVRLLFRWADPLPPREKLSRQSMLRRYMRAQMMVLLESLASHPFFVVRSKMMQRWAWNPLQPEYRSSIDCIRRTWATEGVQGFFHGIGWSVAIEHVPVLLLSLPGTESMLNELTTIVSRAIISASLFMSRLVRTVLRISHSQNADDVDQQLAEQLDGEDAPERRIRRSRSAVW